MKNQAAEQHNTVELKIRGDIKSFRLFKTEKYKTSY